MGKIGTAILIGHPFERRLPLARQIMGWPTHLTQSFSSDLVVAFVVSGNVILLVFFGSVTILGVD